jgi:hypothetical protein
MGVGFGDKGSHLNADYHEEKAAGSVDRARRCFVLELGHGIHDPPPGHRPIVIASRHELVGPRRAFVERLLAVALQHEGGGTPDVYLGDHTAQAPYPRSIKL